jgi:hypothetical protein
MIQFLRLNRLLRVIHLPHLLDLLLEFLHDSTFFHVNSNFLKLVRLLMQMLLISHWLGAGFCLLARLLHERGGVTLTWIQADHVLMYQQNSVSYFARSFLWAIGTISVVRF